MFFFLQLLNQSPVNINNKTFQLSRLQKRHKIKDGRLCFEYGQGLSLLEVVELVKGSFEHQ